MKQTIKKITFEALNNHFHKKHSIFELNEMIDYLKENSFKNKEIAENLNISEESLYNIIPIKNINTETKQLIQKGKIDGYKVGRLMRIIGKNNPNETELIEGVIKKNLSSNKAEVFVSKKRDYNIHKFNLSSWLINGKSNLTKIKEIELKKKDVENIKIIILRLSTLLQKR